MLLIRIRGGVQHQNRLVVVTLNGHATVNGEGRSGEKIMYVCGAEMVVTYGGGDAKRDSSVAGVPRGPCFVEGFSDYTRRFSSLVALILIHITMSSFL